MALSANKILASLVAAVSLLLGASMAVASAAPDAQSAAEIVQSSIGIVQRHHDLSALRSMQLKVRTADRHLTDTDHSDSPPWLIDYADSTWTEDLQGHRRLASSSIATISGHRTEGRILTTAELEQNASIQDGKALPIRVDVALPSWELSNPIRTLLLTKAAPDLHVVGTATVHQMPSDVLGFTHRGFPVKLFISRDTRLPVAVEALITRPYNIAWGSRGDLLDRTEWMNWTFVQGVRFPTQWDTTRNGNMLQTVTVFSAKLDVPLDQKALTPDPHARAQLSLPGRRNVDDYPLGDPDRPIAEIAPGVVQIPGDWYSTLVKQNDGIVVIDAPISNGYSAKVMAEAAKRFPGVPIKALITTTNFFWHTAGLREYAARGIPIYALDRNEGVVRDLLNAPHTLAPDELARNHRKPELHLISARTSLGSGDNELVLIPVRRGSGQMLMVYFPRYHILHTAEMIQPLGPGGSLLFPESLQEVTDAVHDAGITPETMIGMHMSPTPWTRVDQRLAKAETE